MADPGEGPGLFLNQTEARRVACVAGVIRGRGRERGNLGARERAREKGKERLQGDYYCFLHFSRSDTERENSDWSELIKCQSPT